MPILRWRCIEDASYDPGEFECLNCHRSWCSSSSPETWSYCPFCGCAWEGEMRSYGSARARLREKAMNLSRARARFVTHHWEVQEACIEDGNYEPDNVSWFCVKTCYTAKKALELLKSFRCHGRSTRDGETTEEVIYRAVPVALESIS